MGAGEWVAAGIGLAVLALQIAVVVGLWLWAAVVARKHPRGVFRVASWFPRVGTLLLCVGYAITVFSLVRAFAAVAEADASSKATLLARGIGDSMDRGAVVTALGMLLLVLSAVVSLVGTLRAPSAG